MLVRVLWNRFKSFTSAIMIALNSAACIRNSRAGIEAVDKGQMEAARSLGMKKNTAMILR